MQDIILTVSIILAYAVFGVACAVIGYKKGRGIWRETRLR